MGPVRLSLVERQQQDIERSEARGELTPCNLSAWTSTCSCDVELTSAASTMLAHAVRGALVYKQCL
jgi:hypothetical protein